MAEKVIECDHITHYYGNRLIYRDLSFDVEKGKILGLLGKNGTGKTTIINILNGFLKPTQGCCRIFGENVQGLSPALKSRIGLQLENHVSFGYMNIYQIEKFYRQFYPNWDADKYFNLVEKLKVTSKQPLSSMSCGQRSQVVLGLLFAQNPDLLILDDFSMGLDPGYRRLFIEKLREFVSDGQKTVFLTSHIIQDMEQLIDDCIIFDYGKIILHKTPQEIFDSLRRFTFECNAPKIHASEVLLNPEKVGNRWEVYSYASVREVQNVIETYRPTNFKEERLNLEDAFIGLTGKY